MTAAAAAGGREDRKTINNIKLLRRRLGLTQQELGEQLGVDQGTVSRWERGIEAPRPQRMAQLREMLRGDDGDRMVQRSLAIVRHNFMSAGLIDSSGRPSELLESVEGILGGDDTDPDAILAWDIETFASRTGVGSFLSSTDGSVVTVGEALLFRFAQNRCGDGQTIVYEPVFEAGSLKGVLHYITERFRFPDNNENTLELVEVVRADDPGTLLVLHRGQRAYLVERFRSDATSADPDGEV